MLGAPLVPGAANRYQRPVLSSPSLHVPSLSTASTTPGQGHLDDVSRSRVIAVGIRQRRKGDDVAGDEPGDCRSVTAVLAARLGQQARRDQLRRPADPVEHSSFVRANAGRDRGDSGLVSLRSERCLQCVGFQPRADGLGSHWCGFHVFSPFGDMFWPVALGSSFRIGIGAGAWVTTQPSWRNNAVAAGCSAEAISVTGWLSGQPELPDTDLTTMRCEPGRPHCT